MNKMDLLISETYLRRKKITLNILVAETEKRIHNGYRDYDNFDNKGIQKIISKSYDYVQTSEDFDKINGVVNDIMRLHSYYKPNEVKNE